MHLGERSLDIRRLRSGEVLEWGSHGDSLGDDINSVDARPTIAALFKPLDSNLVTDGFGKCTVIV
jgi:hypothetical protein